MSGLIGARSPEGNIHYLPWPTADWSITAKSADNAAVEVVRPAEPGKSHYITYLGGSYSANVTGGEMLLKQGATTVGDFFVHSSRGLPFPCPIRMAPGEAASLRILAGGLGVLGAITLQGFTV